MSAEKMREEFEADWGFTNEEQDCYFIPELNMYGSERVNRAADSKSSAWIYFQRGWKASRASIEVELPAPNNDYTYSDREIGGACEHYRRAKAAIESLGLKIKQ